MPVSPGGERDDRHGALRDGLTQQQQPQNDGDEVLPQVEAAAEEQDRDVPLIPPHEVPAPPPAAASSVSSASAGSASVVSPSCSSAASGGVEATEWPEPMYLFGMDGIMDAGWGGLFPDADGGGMSHDLFDQYPGAGFDQGDDWI
ncbi:hypothetical protein EJB05_50054, partial [Eragrostis curvula]